MKSVIGVGLFVCTLLLFSGCPTVDPLKDLPQTEYELAQRYRARIAKWNFSQYAPDEFSAGEASFQDGEGKMKKDNLAAKKSLDDANGNYKTVMRKGIAAVRKQKDDEITPIREKADTIKTSVAAATEYKDAKETYDKAVALAEEDNWDDAEPLFGEAKQKYEAAYEAARTKKEKADAQREATEKELAALKELMGEPDDGSEPEPEPEPEPAPEE